MSPSPRRSGCTPVVCLRYVALTLAAGLLMAAPAAAQSGTIRGTVTSAATGLPINGASVMFVGPNGASLGSVATNAAGFYEVQFLPPTTYYLAFQSPGFAGEFF